MGAMKAWKSQALLKLEQWKRDSRATLQELSMSPRVLHCVPDKLQARLKTDGDHVHRIASGMEANVISGAASSLLEATDPVVVFRIKGGLHLVDGHHRHGAHLRLRLRSIRAWVIDGTWAEATEFCAGANLENATPTGLEDRRKALRMLLAFPEYFSLPAKRLVPMCGLSVHTVSKIRDEYCEERGLERPTFHVEAERNGKSFSFKRRSPVRPGEPPRLIEIVRPHGKPQFVTHADGKRIYLGTDRKEAETKLSAVAATQPTAAAMDKDAIQHLSRICQEGQRRAESGRHTAAEVHEYLSRMLDEARTRFGL